MLVFIWNLIKINYPDIHKLEITVYNFDQHYLYLISDKSKKKIEFRKVIDQNQYKHDF